MVGLQRPLPVVLTDADGDYVASGGGAIDSAGTPIDPDNMSHVFGYTGVNLTTDTATDGTSTWVKTFTYTNGLPTAESKWVKQ